MLSGARLRLSFTSLLPLAALLLPATAMFAQQKTGSTGRQSVTASQPQPANDLSAERAQTRPPVLKSKQPESQAQPASPASTAAPQMPKTEILDSSATSGALEGDGRDPILDPPPFPTGTTTLVGGIIESVDRVRNRLVIAVFDGEPWTVHFDERTHIFESGAETTELALRKGERAYIDTMSDDVNHNILARNIRLGVNSPPVDADGQIERVDLAHGEISLLDRINSVAVHFGVTAATRIVHGATPGTLKDLKPGALVHVKFLPQSGYRGVAREITIIASPGAAFTFMGRISYLDMHRGLLAVHNRTDDKTYDIHFSPAGLANSSELGIGEEVTVVAIFDGPQYTARTVTIHGRAK